MHGPGARTLPPHSWMSEDRVSSGLTLSTPPGFSTFSPGTTQGGTAGSIVINSLVNRIVRQIERGSSSFLF